MHFTDAVTETSPQFFGFKGEV